MNQLIKNLGLKLFLEFNMARHFCHTWNYSSPLLPFSTIFIMVDTAMYFVWFFGDGLPIFCQHVLFTVGLEL